MYQLVLASQSPRRKNILQREGYFFTIDPVQISEKINKNMNMDDALKEVSKKKAVSSSWTHKHGKILVVAADTVVVLGEEILGKPKNQDECFKFLKLLSGKCHQVKTAWSVFNVFNGRMVSHIDTTRVCFQQLTESQMRKYALSGEGLDKAGGYGIQGAASSFVESIKGEFDTVVGFPVRSFQNFLKEHEIVVPRWVVVSKGQRVTQIQKLYKKGYCHFGENYVQEALEKIKLFKDTQNMYWHFVGRLQTNKVKHVVGHFAFIHSVDSVRLAKKISEKSIELRLRQKIFVQINIGKDPQKAGFFLKDFEVELRQIMQLKGVEVVGFMTMLPLCEERVGRLYFRKMKELARKWGCIMNRDFYLSMGTSADYRIALEEGATHVRVGKVLFAKIR